VQVSRPEDVAGAVAAPQPVSYIITSVDVAGAVVATRDKDVASAVVAP
jgi:hypothetical protein